MEAYYQQERLQQQHQHQHQPQHCAPNSNQARHAGTMNNTDSAPRPAAPSQSGGHSDLIDEHPLMGGDSLDNIVSENHTTLHRRRSMPPPSFGNETNSNRHRRLSTTGNSDMITFGNGNGDMRSYQFNQPLAPNYHTINTTNLTMSNQMGNYMSDQVDYSALSPDMMGTMMPSTFAGLNMDAVTNESPVMNMFSNAGSSSLSATYPHNSMTPIGNEFTLDLQSDDNTLNGVQRNAGAGLSQMDGSESDMMRAAQFNSMDPNEPSTSLAMNNYNQHMPPPLSRHVSSSTSALSPPNATSSGGQTHPGSSSDATTPATTSSLPVQGPKDATVYSKSGFDMLKALWLVATRKSPKIHLGAVDMSCAFVVCDVSMNDCPIIYVSDNFQNLTGYSRHEIVGRNCRFLQAPDGKVEAGSKREFVDDGAVFNLKKMIHEGREVQQSLINYRKGGKPFLNLLTMIPIPWDTEEIRYFIGFQIDLVECPDAIASGQEHGGVKVNYKHSDIGQYIWTPPSTAQWEPESGQTLGVDDVSTLLQQFTPKGLVSDWHKQSWDKMLLENTDDVVHVLSLKGLFLYLSPSCKRILEYDASELVGNSLSTVCHPSDIVPVTRELKDAQAGSSVNISFRIRRKNSGYTWFESHGSLFIEQGKGRKCIILVGRKRPVIALSRRSLEAHGGIGDSELWTKLSTSGMFLFVSSNVRSLLDLQPESLIGTSIQELMRKESRPEFGRAVEKARRGKVVTCKHEVQNRRGQVLQAQTVLYPGDAQEGQKPSFLLAQTKLLKATSRSIAPASNRSGSIAARSDAGSRVTGPVSQPAGGSLMLGTQDAALASDDNMFDELRTTKCSSWQFELRQMEKVNRILAEELGGLLSNKKKRKRRKGVGNVIRDCANCHTRNTPEWRRGPSGQRDLCNSCGLRWAKQTGRVSPRNSSRGGREGAGDSSSKKSASPKHTSPLHKQMTVETPNPNISNGDGAINPAQLAQPITVASVAPPTVQASLAMPPPSQSSVSNGVPAVSMASIREERETSLTG